MGNNHYHEVVQKTVKQLFLIVLLVSVIVLGGFIFLKQQSNTGQDTRTLPSSVSKKDQPAITTIIIPHHDLVKTIRGQFLQKISQTMGQPTTIILASPNHYDTGLGNIQLNDQIWQLIDKRVPPDSRIINSLSGLASIENGSFANEHGIKNVLDDIWQAFPEARIVPLILKSTATKIEIEELSNRLTKNCLNCLLVASVDFSHYQPSLLAELHDDTTVRALENLDADELLKNAEVNSPPSLALAVNWASSHATKKFIIDQHTDSGVLTNTVDQETTTHVFGYYTTGDQASAPTTVSFLIGGDMMFGRMISHTFLAGGLWHSVDQLGERLFWGTDAAVVNLEGPVSTTPVPDNFEPNNLKFNFPPQSIDALKYLRVNVASQANNHSGNAGDAGLQATRELLKKADIQPLGKPNGFDPGQVVSIKGNRLTLDILGVNILWSQPNLSDEIKRLKADPTRRVMIFFHGGVEYQATHTDLQQRMARSWIDAGADIVIGAHPHVIEDGEVYKGRPIFYSLGNLLFDQTFSAQTQQGLLVAGKFTDTGLQLFALPVQSTKYKPALMTGSTKRDFLENIYQPFSQYLKSTPAGTVVDIPY